MKATNRLRDTEVLKDNHFDMGQAELKRTGIKLHGTVQNATDENSGEHPELGRLTSHYGNNSCSPGNR